MHYQRWFTTGDVGPAARMTNKFDPDATAKPCSKCKQVKDLGEFFNQSKLKASDGRTSACKACMQIGINDRRIRRKYGLTVADVEEMKHEQGGLCAVCKGEPDWRGLVIDHCHSSNRVRGLLCNNCNAMLGMAADNIQTLISAIQYLETHK